MSIIPQLLILLSMLVFWVPALAQSEDSNLPPPLVLNDDQGEYKLGHSMQILEDPRGTLTIQEVSSLPYSEKFITSSKEVPTFGYSSKTYWVRFRLKNESHLSETWLLELQFSNMQYADLYLPSPDGKGFVARETGVLRPFNTRDIDHHHIVFGLPLPENEEQTFYMRFQSGTSMTLPLVVWSSKAFIQSSSLDLLLIGIFYGVFLIMLVFNLFLFLSLREVNYLYFIFFLVSGLLFFISYDAIGDQYLWPNLPAINLYAVPLSSILVFVSTLKFTDNFLEFGARNPKLHRIFNIALIGWGFLLLLLPIVSYHVIFNLIAPFGILCLGLAGVTGAISLRGGYRPARFFLISWVGFLMGVSLQLLVRLGFVPSTFFTEQSYRLAMVWLIAFWAIALSDRINVLKLEKEKAVLENQERESRYRNLVETMNEGLAEIDENGNFAFVNPRLAEMLGYPPEELIGRSIYTVADGEDRQVIKAQFSGRQWGKNSPYEITLRRKDGTNLFAMVGPMPVFDGDRAFKGSIAVVTDISERVQANRLLEQRVAERTRELSTLLDLSHEITSTQELDSVLNRILERLQMIVDHRHSAIIMFERDGWRLKASQPPKTKIPEDLILSGEAAHTLAQVLEPGKPVLLSKEIEGFPAEDLRTLAIKLKQLFRTDDSPWLGIPILRKERLTGLLVLCSAGRDGFSEEELKVAESIANQAAVVIENNLLLEQVQMAAAYEERNHLAQELHDSVTQTLFTASVLAQATPRIWEKDQGIARQNLEKLNVLIRGALAEMRSLLLELRSGELHNQTLNQLLSTLADAGRVRTRAEISLSVTGVRTLPDNITLTFYRVAQESLNNAINHAGANIIKINLVEESKQVMLMIEDDGQGFDPRTIPEGHLGLEIMAERVAEIGAILKIRSRPGQGTRITLTWKD
jgi:PAS domain S-box-containing protein